MTGSAGSEWKVHCGSWGECLSRQGSVLQANSEFVTVLNSNLQYLVDFSEL